MSRCLRIIDRAVMILKRDLKEPAQRIEFVPCDLGNENLCHLDSIDKTVFPDKPRGLFFCRKESHVKLRVMCDKDRIGRKLFELSERIIYKRCIGDHVVIDVSKLFYPVRYRNAGIDECRKPSRYPSVLNRHRTYLDDVVKCGRKSRCLKIEYDKPLLYAVILRIDRRHLFVINDISFHSVYDLDVIDLFVFDMMECLGKCLYDTMVGDGDRFVPPAPGSVYDIRNGRHSVHIGHLRMTVKLDSFD